MPAPAQSLAALLLLLQTPAAQRAAPAGENLLTGAAVSVDREAGTVTLRPRSGSEATFKVTDKTLILRARRISSLDQIPQGEELVARYRKSASPPRPLYDLADRSSWDWLKHMRKETVRAEVARAEAGWLHVVEGSEKLPFAYRVTAKTAWMRDGKAAASEDFKPGDAVWISPRLLPNGATMATAVADSAKWAAILKERGSPTLSGAVTSLDAAARTLRISTRAGDDAVLRLADSVEVRQNAKPVPLTQLKVGTRITAHLRRGDAEEREVVRITIQGGASARPSAASPARKPPAKKN